MNVQKVEPGQQLYFANEQGVFAPLIIKNVNKENIEEGYITVEAQVNEKQPELENNENENSAVSKFYLPINQDIYFINLISTEGDGTHMILSNDTYPISLYLTIIAEKYELEVQRGIKEEYYSYKFAQKIRQHIKSIKNIAYKINNYKPLIPKELRNLNNFIAYLPN